MTIQCHCKLISMLNAFEMVTTNEYCVWLRHCTCMVFIFIFFTLILVFGFGRRSKLNRMKEILCKQYKTKPNDSRSFRCGNLTRTSKMFNEGIVLLVFKIHFTDAHKRVVLHSHLLQPFIRWKHKSTDWKINNDEEKNRLFDSLASDYEKLPLIPCFRQLKSVMCFVFKLSFNTLSWIHISCCISTLPTLILTPMLLHNSSAFTSFQCISSGKMAVYIEKLLLNEILFFFSTLTRNDHNSHHQKLFDHVHANTF